MNESMLACLFGIYIFAVLYFLGISFWGGEDPLGKQLNRIQNMGRRRDALLMEERKNGKKKQKGSGMDVPGHLQEDLDGAGIPLRASEFLGLWLISATIFPFLAYIITRALFPAFLGLVAGGILPPMIVRILWHKRKSEFSVQLGDALMAVSSCLRSGFSIYQSVERISTDMPNPIAQEFKTAVSEMNYGVSLEDALRSMSKRMDNRDLNLVTTAITIQQQVGGNLSEIIDHVAETIKERIRIRRVLNTLTAQGKMSGMVLSCLPVLMLIMLTLVNRDYVDILYTTSYGHMVLMGVSAMEIIGMLVIYKVINIPVD